jgi:hypothetical protein
VEETSEGAYISEAQVTFCVVCISDTCFFITVESHVNFVCTQIHILNGNTSEEVNRKVQVP